jgi:hypothetical protein
LSVCARNLRTIGDVPVPISFYDGRILVFHTTPDSNEAYWTARSLSNRPAHRRTAAGSGEPDCLSGIFFNRSNDFFKRYGLAAHADSSSFSVLPCLFFHAMSPLACPP